MGDTSIRPVTIAEQARAAAERFVQTGEAESNPHQGLATEQAWRSAYQRWLLWLTRPDDSCEGSA